MPGPLAIHHPALLAKMASTVDVLSHGRLTVGIGAGDYEEEFRAYGYAYPDAPRVRVRSCSYLRHGRKQPLDRNRRTGISYMTSPGNFGCGGEEQEASCPLTSRSRILRRRGSPSAAAFLASIKLFVSIPRVYQQIPLTFQNDLQSPRMSFNLLSGKAAPKANQRKRWYADSGKSRMTHAHE